jgi:hypothetical protein
LRCRKETSQACLSRSRSPGVSANT